jgi:hypothetical protein
VTRRLQNTLQAPYQANVTSEELASYTLHALAAAAGLPSEAAVRRLVTVTLDGLRPAR